MVTARKPLCRIWLIRICACLEQRHFLEQGIPGLSASHAGALPHRVHRLTGPIWSLSKPVHPRQARHPQSPSSCRRPSAATTRLRPSASSATTQQPVSNPTASGHSPRVLRFPRIGLQWGDLVEVRIQSGDSNNQKPPTIDDLAAQIPPRNVTFTLGALEIPMTIPGNGAFWLDYNSRQTIPELILVIDKIADLTHFVVHRKGAPEPITLDFTEPNRDLFRLIDGDRIEMALDVEELDRQFGGFKGVSTINRNGVSTSSSDQNMYLIQTLHNVDELIDFQKILVLRSAEKWKPEVIDVKAWLDALPPEETWQRDAEALKASAPKLNSGDALVLLGYSGKESKRPTPEIRKKLQSVGAFSARPRIVPPPPTQ